MKKNQPKNSYIVSITKDGSAWCALIGNNLQEGYAGFGETVPEALRDLSYYIEDNYQEIQWQTQ